MAVRAELRRAAGILLVAALAAALCVVAGLWQWQRHAERVAASAQLEAHYDAVPSALADVLAADGSLPDDAPWTPVAVRGRYLDTEPVVLRNRPVDGRPAVRLLHPFVVGEGPHAGAVLVLDRGWVPTADGETERRPPAPAGEVDVVARLRPAEAGEEPVGPRQVRTVEAGAVLAAGLGDTLDPLDDAGLADGGQTRLLPAYGLLVSEDGAPPAGTAPLPRPEVGLGSHLSYAFQWWVFALGALVGAVVLIVRDRRAVNGADGAGATPGDPQETREPQPREPRRPGAEPHGRSRASRPLPSRRRRPTAEEEEDALLDAQVRSGSP